MDNPQANLAAAWIAGLWLADGYFGLSKSDIKGGYTRWYPRNSLVCKDKPVIEAAYRLLRESGVGAHISSRKKRDNWSTVYELQCQGWKRTEGLLNLLLPYLVGRKRASALILLSICQTDLHGGKGRMDAKGHEYREWCFRTLKALNQRGEGASETIIEAPPGTVDEGIVQALKEI